MYPPMPLTALQPCCTQLDARHADVVVDASIVVRSHPRSIQCSSSVVIFEVEVLLRRVTIVLLALALALILLAGGVVQDSACRRAAKRGIQG